MGMDKGQEPRTHRCCCRTRVVESHIEIAMPTHERSNGAHRQLRPLRGVQIGQSPLQIARASNRQLALDKMCEACEVMVDALVVAMLSGCQPEAFPHSSD